MYVPKAIKTSGMTQTYMIGKIILAVSQFQFKGLTIDIKYGRGSSNKMHTQLQPKNTKVRLY